MASIIERWQSKAMEPTFLCTIPFNWSPWSLLQCVAINALFCSIFIGRKSKCNADEELNRMFKILSSQENDVVRPRTITHLGRDLTFEKTCGQVLFSTFDELCDRVSSQYWDLTVDTRKHHSQYTTNNKHQCIPTDNSHDFRLCTFI